MLYKAEPDYASAGVDDSGSPVLTAADFEADYTVDVWPDNVLSIDVFEAMTTQWRVSYSGRTGLDYAVLPQVMEMLDVPRAEWPHLFSDVRVLEVAALQQMNEN